MSSARTQIPSSFRKRSRKTVRTFLRVRRISEACACAHTHTHKHKRRAVSESTRQRRYGRFYKKANPAGVAPFPEAQTTPQYTSVERRTTSPNKVYTTRRQICRRSRRWESRTPNIHKPNDDLLRTSNRFYGPVRLMGLLLRLSSLLKAMSAKLLKRVA